MSACDFESHGCSHAVRHRGGFHEHHAFPKHLGGDPDQETLLTLCPNHHYRQHSLIRFLIEGGDSWDVEKHFTEKERSFAHYAHKKWKDDGGKEVEAWTTLPATE